MDKFFFPNAPMAQILAAVNQLKLQTKLIRQFIKNKIGEFDIVIGQGNRPDRLHTQFIDTGIITQFDYFFTGSKIGFEDISKNWFEREVVEGLTEQMPYIWDSPVMWQKFWELLNENRDKKILLISSAPRKEHANIFEYKNITFTSPRSDLAVKFEYDKRKMQELYISIGIPYDVYNYDSSEVVTKGYEFHSLMLDTSDLVIQATMGSGGVTMKSSIQALFFVNNPDEFQNALYKLRGEGPVRVMKRYGGVGSNSAALALPGRTYISGIPTVKPCHGIPEVGTKSGTSPGNQWDQRFPGSAVNAQFEQLMKVGYEIAAQGFIGVFGLDPIMPLTEADTVFNSEINARSQGPDAQRAFAMHNLGIVSLEELQLAYYLGISDELFPSCDDYNLITRWLKIPPYLKLFAKEAKIVKKDLNGYWNFTETGLQKSDNEQALFRITGAPRLGQKITVTSPDNFLYIKFLDNDFKIFTDDKEPGLTPQALEIVNHVYEII